MKKINGIAAYFKFVAKISNRMPDDFIEKISDIEFGQWENSFEALLLEIINKKVDLDNFEFIDAENLAIEANIIDEGVLYPNTWKEFCEKYKK